MADLWGIIQTLGEVVLTLGDKLWGFLTTPVMTMLDNWGVLAFLEDHSLLFGWVEDVIQFLFGDNGTFIFIIPVAIAVILVSRFVSVVFGR